MGAISTDDVLHIAALARLLLKPKEVQKFTTQLASILTYVEKLNELNTDQIKPTQQVTDVVNSTRRDGVKKTNENTIRAIMDRVPKTDAGGVQVPLVLNE